MIVVPIQFWFHYPNFEKLTCKIMILIFLFVLQKCETVIVTIVVLHNGATNNSPQKSNAADYSSINPSAAVELCFG
jgi:hypothetical protein